MALRLPRWRPKVLPQKQGEIRQELHCHECGHYVEFILDISVNGNHVLNCPNCGHEHCRVVENGKITSVRWDSRNGPPIQMMVVSCTSTSTFDGVWDSTSATGGTYDDAISYYTWGS